MNYLNSKSTESVTMKMFGNQKLNQISSEKTLLPTSPPLCEHFARKIGSENLIRILFRHNG